MCKDVENMAAETGDIIATTAEITSGISGLNIDLTDTVGQEINQDLIAWYKQRFDMFRADGCPGAITEYLKMLLGEDVNDITRALILREALLAQET